MIVTRKEKKIIYSIHLFSNYWFVLCESSITYIRRYFLNATREKKNFTTARYDDRLKIERSLLSCGCLCLTLVLYENVKHYVEIESKRTCDSPSVRQQQQKKLLIKIPHDEAITLGIFYVSHFFMIFIEIQFF